MELSSNDARAAHAALGPAIERLYPIDGANYSAMAADADRLLAAFASDVGTFVGGGAGNSKHSKHSKRRVGLPGARRDDDASAIEIVRAARDATRRGVDAFARFTLEPVVSTRGLKEMHAMQLATDAAHLNERCVAWERSAASAAVAAFTGDDGGVVVARETTADGNKKWAPFESLAASATATLNAIVARRVDELMTSSSAAADWDPPSPPTTASETISGVVVYLDGILRFASTSLPPAAAGALARAALRAASASALAPLTRVDGGVRKFTIFGVVGLTHDLEALESLADAMQGILSSASIVSPTKKRGDAAGGGGGFAEGRGRLRDALFAPRAFVELMSSSNASSSSSSSSGGNGEVAAVASALDVNEAAKAGVDAAALARALEKYREISAATKLMAMVDRFGGDSDLAGRAPTKRDVDAAVKVLRARASGGGGGGGGGAEKK